MLLTFGRANAKLKELEKKLGKRVYTFSTLAGFACPMAHECLSKAVETNGKMHIQDGPNTLFRCFSASQEVMFPSVYKSRKKNFELLRILKSADEQAELIRASLPHNTSLGRNKKGICKFPYVVRINVSGDMFNQANFDAWNQTAKTHPYILFYAYTKSLPYWVKRLGEIADNFILTASYGGKKDELIKLHNLRSVKVVFSELEALVLGLEIDSDDFHAAEPSLKNQDFALLIHGMQPKGSAAGKAVKQLNGVGSYGKKSASKKAKV